MISVVDVVNFDLPNKLILLKDKNCENEYEK